MTEAHHATSGDLRGFAAQQPIPTVLTAGLQTSHEGQSCREMDTSPQLAAAPLTLRKIVVLLLVIFVLLLVFGTALAGLLVNLR